MITLLQQRCVVCLFSTMSSSGGGAVLTPSSLAAFFVFNPTLGDEMSEANKILFFYPEVSRHADVRGLITSSSSTQR